MMKAMLLGLDSRTLSGEIVLAYFPRPDSDCLEI